jgi:hydrogenase maturation protease
MTGPVRKTLIIGLGNPLLGDDGVGWQVAERLRQQPLPPGVEVDTLALGGIGLMERLVGYQRAVVVDAQQTGQLPTGSVTSFALDSMENPFAGHMGSPHETNLQTALQLGKSLGALLPEEVMVVAIESPYVYKFSDQLSPPAAAAVDVAARLAYKLASPKIDQEE